MALGHHLRACTFQLRHPESSLEACEGWRYPLGVCLRVSRPRRCLLLGVRSSFTSHACTDSLPSIFPNQRAYERLTPAYQKFLEGLTALHDANIFHQVAEAAGEKAFTALRGHPLNDGPNYTATHPVIRTNPMTGWRGVSL